MVTKSDEQLIPAQPGYAVLKQRQGKLGVPVDWIEMEPVIAWLYIADDHGNRQLAPVTLKHGVGATNGFDVILYPDGKVFDEFGTHDNLKEWQRFSASPNP
jgi:hypothetical protein